MKQFSCGDIVPGCRRQFTGPDDASILAQVGEHARADHGIDNITHELAEQVRAALTPA